MVPRASFEICAKCVKSAQLFFVGPSGGKSDAADPFLIVPRSSFEISGRHVSRCLGGNREAKSILSFEAPPVFATIATHTHIICDCGVP